MPTFPKEGHYFWELHPPEICVHAKQTLRYQGSLQFQDFNHPFTNCVGELPCHESTLRENAPSGSIVPVHPGDKNRGWLTQVIWDTGSKSMLHKKWTCSLLRWTINKCFNVSSSLGCRRFQEQFGAVKPGSEVKPLFYAIDIRWRRWRLTVNSGAFFGEFLQFIRFAKTSPTRTCRVK